MAQFKANVWDGLQWQTDATCWVWNGLTWVSSTQPYIWNGLTWVAAQSSIITINLGAPTISGVVRESADPCATVDYTLSDSTGNPAGTVYNVYRNTNGGAFSIIATGVAVGARTDGVTQGSSYSYKAIAHHPAAVGFIYNDSGFGSGGSVSTYSGAC